MSIADFPILNVSVPVVDKKGNPNPQFNLIWNRLKRALEASDAQQQATIEVLQNQQALLTGLVVYLAQQVAYLVNLNAWNQDLQTATLARLSYTQCATGLIARDTGTDISSCGDPGTFPVWPGPPPTPPGP